MGMWGEEQGQASAGFIQTEILLVQDPSMCRNLCVCASLEYTGD